MAGRSRVSPRPPGSGPGAQTRVFVGDAAVAAVPPDDRGFAYGDGLFETMRAHRGALPWWGWHWARLRRGAVRLKLALPDEARVRDEAERLLDSGDGVLKLVVSRGGGGRGYAPPRPAAAPTWILSRHPPPPIAPAGGIVLRWCTTRLATQPALAGLKHCNRLEQVLARAEWDDQQAPDRDADDGLMCSLDGDVVCATAANLFVLHGGRWLTPRLDRCGVEGVCRAWVLGALEVEQARLPPALLQTADAVFLCNAVRGILPVARLAASTWPTHPQVIALQRRLAGSHPAFTTPEMP